MERADEERGRSAGRAGTILRTGTLHPDLARRWAEARLCDDAGYRGGVGSQTRAGDSLRRHRPARDAQVDRATAGAGATAAVPSHDGGPAYPPTSPREPAGRGAHRPGAPGGWI